MAAFLKYLSEALSGWVDDIWGEERDCNYGDMPMIKILIYSNAYFVLEGYKMRRISVVVLFLSFPVKYSKGFRNALYTL